MNVLLVDDHPLVLSALQAVIKTVGSNTTVKGVHSAADARTVLARDDSFDLVLLDLSLGDADGFDVLVEFRAAYPALPVVVVSASDRASDVIRAIDSGAMGFVPKKSSYAELHEALRMVMTGSMYVPPSMLGLDFGRKIDFASDMRPGAGNPTDTSIDPSKIGAVGDAMGSDAFGPDARADPHQRVPSLDDVGLTPRQAEVMGLLLKGLPNKLIARELNLSVETVKDHVAAVLRALGVSSRTQAVLAVSQMTQGQGGFVPKRVS
jgi:DNA-binding NarL/FixJ family response regulator